MQYKRISPQKNYEVSQELVDAQTDINLKRQYKTFLPKCNDCTSDEKKPITRTETIRKTTPTKNITRHFHNLFKDAQSHAHVL